MNKCLDNFNVDHRKFILKIIKIYFKREVPFELNLYVEYIIDSPPYVPYEVQVSAKNVRGEGPKSNITIIYTAEGSKKYKKQKKEILNLVSKFFLYL